MILMCGIWHCLPLVVFRERRLRGMISIAGVRLDCIKSLAQRRHLLFDLAILNGDFLSLRYGPPQFGEQLIEHGCLLGECAGRGALLVQLGSRSVLLRWRGGNRGRSAARTARRWTQVPRGGIFDA